MFEIFRGLRCFKCHSQNPFRRSANGKTPKRGFQTDCAELGDHEKPFCVHLIVFSKEKLHKGMLWRKTARHFFRRSSSINAMYCGFQRPFPFPASIWKVLAHVYSPISAKAFATASCACLSPRMAAGRGCSWNANWRRALRLACSPAMARRILSSNALLYAASEGVTIRLSV